MKRSCLTLLILVSLALRLDAAHLAHAQQGRAKPDATSTSAEGRASAIGGPEARPTELDVPMAGGREPHLTEGMFADPAPLVTPAAWEGAYVDLDVLDAPRGPRADSAALVLPGGDEPYSLQVLPTDLIYKSYLAGVKESRLSAHIQHTEHDAWLWDATLGGRVGLLRYGTRDRFFPQGWQVDAEGSAQVRLDIPGDVDVRSVDFRAGVPVTYAAGRHQTKFAYYHLSSHLGDEFLLKNPGYPRLNFARDVLVLGHAVNLTDDVRIYGEAGWAFYTDVSKEWEFQFGLDYAPLLPTGIHGAPFFAVNTHLRQDVDFGGNFTLQTGWAWRGDANQHLLRMGLHYLNGKSNQFSFFNEHEQQIGFGVWYDW